MGFSRDTIQKMGCPASDLQTAAGGSVQWVACRMGFGDGLRSFEVAYPPTKGKVKLSFHIEYDDGAVAPSTEPEQLEDEGATATFEVELPAR